MIKQIQTFNAICEQGNLLLIFMPPKEGNAPDLLPSAKEVVLGLLLLMISPHSFIQREKGPSRRHFRAFFEFLNQCSLRHKHFYLNLVA